MYCRGFSFDLVTRVWDIFFSEGYKIVYRVALALVKVIHIVNLLYSMLCVYFVSIFCNFIFIPITLCSSHPIEKSILFLSVLNVFLLLTFKFLFSPHQIIPTLPLFFLFLLLLHFILLSFFSFSFYLLPSSSYYCTILIATIFILFFTVSFFFFFFFLFFIASQSIEKELLSSTFEDILLTFRTIPKLVDAERLMELVWTINLKGDEIVKYERQVGECV
jgi:Rab-GTPase-TBC domain